MGEVSNDTKQKVIPEIKLQERPSISSTQKLTPVNQKDQHKAIKRPDLENEPSVRVPLNVQER